MEVSGDYVTEWNVNGINLDDIEIIIWQNLKPLKGKEEVGGRKCALIACVSWQGMRGQYCPELVNYRTEISMCYLKL